MALCFSDLGDKSKTQQAINYINEALVQLSLSEAELNKAALGADKKPMAIVYANLMKQLRYVNDYKTLVFDGKEIKGLSSGYYSWNSRENNVDTTCTVALSHAEFLMAESIKLHEANIDAIENNKLIVASVKTLMAKLGVSDIYKTYDYVGYSGRRVQKQQEHSHRAGYLEDLNRCIKVDDGFSVAESSYKDFVKKVQEYKEKFAKEERDAKAKKEAEEQKIRDDKELATLIVKYKLEYQSVWRDVLTAIIEQDKYLELGYWLERQRNSWADGFWKVRDGINGFKVETDIDQLIYDEISSLAEDCDDGRTFRDCQYNYSTLYGMVENSDLLEDFRLVFDKIASDLD